MYSDIQVQELGVKHVTGERLKEAATRDMIRLAKAGRPARTARIRHAIGAMLISTGEWLRATTMETRGTIETGTDLSQMKT